MVTDVDEIKAEQVIISVDDLGTQEITINFCPLLKRRAALAVALTGEDNMSGEVETFWFQYPFHHLQI